MTLAEATPDEVTAIAGKHGYNLTTTSVEGV
jgi:hypothetical protein